MEEVDKTSIPWMALFTIVTGSFAAVLVSSSVNVALPRLMSVFGVAADSIQWVITIYTLVSGVVVPITGYLSERFGCKRLYIFSLAVFVSGSLLCTMAWSVNSLIAARMLQAIGGGMMMPVGMIILYLIIPRDRIGMAMGVYGVALIVAPAIGPTIGGYLVDKLSWEWVFLTNVPVGIVAIFLSAVLLKETPRRRDLKPDVLGIVLCTAACFTLLLALSQGQKEGWTSLYIVDLFLFSGFSCILFVIWELNIPQPLLNMRVLKNRTFCISLIASSFITIGMYSVTFIIPIYSQTIMGYTPMQTGLILMPAAVTLAVMMPISGRLFDKIGAAPLCIVGISLMVYYTYQMHNLDLGTSVSEMQWMLVKRSIGMGLAMMPVSTVGMNTIPRLMISQGSALVNLIRNMAVSIGIPCVVSVMNHQQAYHSAWLADTVNWSSYPSMSAISKLQGALVRKGISAVYAKPAALGLLSSLKSRLAFVCGIDDTLVVAAVVMSVAIPLGFFFNMKAVEIETEKQHQRFLHLADQVRDNPEG